MNNTIKNDSADEKVWQRYRSKIESLYWENSLNTIEVHMKERHGFVASKSQYERHFRKWGLRKNLTGPEWGIIIRYIKRNSICLEQAEVLFKGHEIPQSRIIQEIARRNSRINTSQNGPHKLPEDITVRPRSCAPNIDTTNGLQITQDPAINSSSSFMQLETGLDLITITSPSINSHTFNEFVLIAECTIPFSWIYSVDLDSISRSLYPSQQLMKWKEPTKTQLDAIFYPMHQSPVDTTHGSHSTVLPLSTIASLVNNVSSVGHTTSNDAYALLKLLPLDVVSRSLENLPVPIQDVLRERMFATAVKTGDTDLVSAMLRLNMDPHERIMLDCPNVSKPRYPLEYAIAAGHLAVARILVSHMCHGATPSQLDDIFVHLSRGRALSYDFPGITRLRESEMTELKCIAFSARASPTQKCLATDMMQPISVASLKQLIDSTAAGIIAWLEIGLLEFYLINSKGRGLETRAQLAIDVLQCIFHDYQHHLPMGDPKLKTILLNALRVAITRRNTRAVEMILEAFSIFRCLLDGEVARVGDTETPSYNDSSILHALGNANWHSAAFLMVARRSMTNPETLPQRRSFKTNSIGLKDAIEKKNLNLAYLLLEEGDFKPLYAAPVIQLAISLGQPGMVIAIIKNMENHERSGTLGLISLLEHGQTTTVSALLTDHPTWKLAFEAASQRSDYGPLETIIFQGSAPPFIGLENNNYLPLVLDQQQLCFRVIAFQAIATDNFRLCKWLFQLGMDADELFLMRHPLDYSLYMSKFPLSYCTLSRSGSGGPDDNVKHTLPSLLAIAAEKNNLEWMKFILAEGVSAVDSMALLRAVKSKATVATIRFLLQPVKTGRRSAERTYGIAALRQAIQFRDFTIINLLCEVVHIDAIEPLLEEFLDRRVPISPLGEAIILKDPETVKVLLQQGANPNAYVSFDGVEALKHIKNHLQRVTPLLVAIDVQSLSIVKILLQYGAELQYTRNMGILRTPLQRAAEMGCFDIVQYLTQQNAIVDTIPVHSGGTALQLAAMNGFCGIVAFLLGQGADPNYPPAKGDGRTAFEAAAEWGHIDTMSQLMQCNVNLDSEVGQPPESQYERARRFAERNGFPASKRFVEHLYRQVLGDQSWGNRMALDFP